MEGNYRSRNLESSLRSDKISTVLTALFELKDTGNITFIPILLELLSANPDEQVEKEIIEILNNLKVQKAVPVLVKALKDPEYYPIRKKIITACWQNGLDYKNELPLFVDLVIQEEWETGFEAFTVIENMEEYPDSEIIDIAVHKIQEALPEADGKKKYFLQEILILIC
jgi:HEAT repeat protein